MDIHTHTPTNYNNPRYACTQARVDYITAVGEAQITC